jgi:hypothetical protein
MNDSSVLRTPTDSRQPTPSRPRTDPNECGCPYAKLRIKKVDCARLAYAEYVRKHDPRNPSAQVTALRKAV